MNWYPYFLCVVAVLWAFSTPRDRIALRIILGATIGSFLLTEGVTRHIAGAWKLVFPGATETVTILALLHWTPNRSGYMQIACLTVAWLAHVLCYCDLVWNTDLIYSRYAPIIQIVAIAQIAACHDTIRNLLRRLGHWLGNYLPRRLGGFLPTGVSAHLLRNPRPPGV